MPEFDNTQAETEGWFVSEVGAPGDMFRLEKDDEAAKFKTDQDAWEHVIRKAIDGSIYHISALKFMELNGEADFELIEQHAAFACGSNGVSYLFALLPDAIMSDAIEFTAKIAEEIVPKVLNEPFDNGDTLAEEALKGLGLRYLNLIAEARNIVAQESM